MSNTDNVDISKLGAVYSEEHQKLEENAIIKYEKGVKPYRKKYTKTFKQVQCQNCGSVYNLTKTVYNGEEYWFCKDCIAKRAMEIKQKEG